MRVLCLDSGSSSLKFGLYDMPAETLVRSGEAPGLRGAAQAEALAGIIDASDSSAGQVDAVGHRIVAGGPEFARPRAVDDALVAALASLVALDPLHLPAQLSLVRRARELLPSATHVACFDTAFFHDMPALAQRLPLPGDAGRLLRRYGYHGLSYEYVVSTGLARGRAIVAHLGSGASMAALRDGTPVDTTMGFSPLGGLMMGTRPGDLDPGALLYLLRSGAARDVDALGALLNERSGLRGVSATSSDMRELLARSSSDERARDAVALFIYVAVKHAAALAAVLGGIDTLVFTGGIGERAAPVRAGICGGLAHLGVELDPASNERGDERISSERSGVRVLVVPTNESLIIARHTRSVAVSR